ncbi:MAG: hypothetical protein ACYC8V_16265, partial [Caulobacteraceae bacterium]
LTGAGSALFTGGSDTWSNLTLSAARTSIAGAAVTLSGALTSTSRVAATGTITVAAAGATLSGNGSLTLGNAAGNKIVGANASATLTNVGERLGGAGNIGGGSLTLVNQAKGSIVSAGSTGLTIDTGASTVANAGLIEAGKGTTLTVKSAVANTGRLGVAAGGTVILDGPITGTGSAFVAGGALEALGAFNEKVSFVGSGVLELADSQAYTAKVSGFSKTATTSFDLLDIAYTQGVTGTTYQDNGKKTGGVLTVTDGTHTARINMVGDFSASTFTVASDGHGGTLIVDPKAGAATAFAQAAAALGRGAGSAAPAAQESWRAPPLLARPHALA